VLAVRPILPSFIKTRLTFPSHRLCLQKLGVLTKEDNTAVVIKIFWKYVGFLSLS
jgi:hypothetical protein